MSNFRDQQTFNEKQIKLFLLTSQKHLSAIAGEAGTLDGKKPN
jgi:hypothetical protein